MYIVALTFKYKLQLLIAVIRPVSYNIWPNTYRVIYFVKLFANFRLLSLRHYKFTR